MPPPPTEWIAWLERLSGAGLGVLASTALLGSFFGVWIWGRHHREYVAELKANHAEEVADLKAQLAKSEANAQRWEDQAMAFLVPLDRLADSNERLARKR